MTLRAASRDVRGALGLPLAFGYAMRVQRVVGNMMRAIFVDHLPIFLSPHVYNSLFFDSHAFSKEHRSSGPVSGLLCVGRASIRSDNYICNNF
jgi:hypothetical protein